MNKAVIDSTEGCKTTTEKVDKLISNTIAFMEAYQSTYNTNTVSITKLQDDLAVESKVMDALAVKIEKVKVLGLKLENAEKKVKDLLFEKAVVRSCILEVTILLSVIIETRDPMITITVWKHLAEKLCPVFAMLQRLQGVSPHNSYSKQGGEGGSGVSRNKPPKDPTKPIVKTEPKGKEKPIGEDPIINNDEEEEPDEAELKRRKSRDAKLNENQCVVKETEEKEKAEKEAQSTLKRKMLFFTKWTLKRIQHDTVDLTSQYWLDLVASFDLQHSQDLQLDLPITPKAFSEAPKDFEKLKPG
ncbi:unnamed protein product [Lactuca saligna]|uniref:Uncharacterized protein n=1 Tax=Lactuca saligna TaxID=75948 RepID=A0AA36E491_LACSI|nr:unnamed protein product [Lactuca saligna]